MRWRQRFRFGNDIGVFRLRLVDKLGLLLNYGVALIVLNLHVREVYGRAFLHIKRCTSVIHRQLRVHRVNLLAHGDFLPHLSLTTAICRTSARCTRHRDLCARVDVGGSAGERVSNFGTRRHAGRVDYGCLSLARW